MRPTSTQLSTATFLTAFSLLSAGCAAPGSSAAAGKGGPGRTIRPIPVVGVAPTPVTLASVREQWNGSLAQIRFPMKLKKGKGWVESPWMEAPTLPGEPPMFVRLLAADRNRLEREGRLTANGEIRPGTIFVVEDWLLTDSKKRRGLAVDLRFADTPVQARLEFKGTDRLEDLEQVERVSRIELFQLREKQPAAPVAARAPQALQILEVRVEPAVAGPNEDINLVIAYAVPSEGEVTEERELRFRGQVAANFSEQKRRQPGQYTSSYELKIEPGTPAGTYTFQANLILSAAGGSETERASASFEVR